MTEIIYAKTKVHLLQRGGTPRNISNVYFKLLLFAVSQTRTALGSGISTLWQHEKYLDCVFQLETEAKLCDLWLHRKRTTSDFLPLERV